MIPSRPALIGAARLAVSFALLLAGCEDPPRPTPPPSADRGHPDQAPPDATGPDATAPDATGPDATGPDAAGIPDLGPCPPLPDPGPRPDPELAPDPAAPFDPPAAPPGEDGCLADELFVDVPLWRPPVERLADPRAALRAACEAAAGARAAALCPAFDAATWGELPRDPQAATPLAPGRHFRLRFAAPQPPEVLGQAVADLRRLVRTALEGPDPGQWGAEPAAFVGRSCLAVILGADGAPSPEMLDWHLRSLGPAAADTPPFTVALIDTGLGEGLALPLRDQADLRPEGPRHPHASKLGLILAQAAGAGLRISDYRALDASGTGPTDAVAQAIRRALDDHAAHGAEAGPLVLNLSLGWPPELGLPRASLVDLAGNPVTEDPIGGPVHGLLAEINVRAELSPVGVVAAAGNRPGPAVVNARKYPAWFQVVPGAQAPTGCAPEVPAGPGAALFHPAEWGRLPTCAPGRDPARLALAVGGHDPQGLPTGLDLADGAPPLRAPARHVYAPARPGVPAPPVAAACAAAPAGQALSLPAPVTGTSAAAVLASAAAGRLLALGIEGPRAFERAAALLRITADAGRLSRCRAEAGRLCRGIMTCANALLDDPDADPACDLGRCPLAGCPAPELREIPWPVGYLRPEPELCACHTAATPSVPAGPCTQADRACPPDRFVDPHSTGLAASQPGEPSCPDCRLLVGAGEPAMRLELSFNHQLPARPVKAAWLVLDDPQIGPGFIDLWGHTDLSRWKAYADVTVKGLPASGCPTIACTAKLVIVTLDEHGKQAALTELLRVEKP